MTTLPRHRAVSARSTPSGPTPVPPRRQRSRTLVTAAAGLALVLSGGTASAAPASPLSSTTRPAWATPSLEPTVQETPAPVIAAGMSLQAIEPAQQLANRRIASRGTSTLRLTGVPTGATAVSLVLTTGGARQGTMISGCAGAQPQRRCTTRLMAVPRWSGTSSTRTVLVALGGGANDTLTLTSSTASVQLGLEVVGFVSPTPPAPAPAPVPAPAAPVTPPPVAPAVPAPAPAPAPTATATATADPDGAGNWPTAATTGVPAGTTLTDSGPITVTQPGAVLDGLRVQGNITVRANNVTIKNTLVLGGQIDNGDGQVTGTVVQDVEIDGSGTDYVYNAVSYSGLTALRMNIHDVGVGFQVTDDIVVRDSYVHDLVVRGDPAAGGSHNEAFLSNGGQNMVVTNNRFNAGAEDNFSSSLSLYGDFEQIDNVLVQNNLFNGGGYCVYGGSVSTKPYPVATNTRFTGNTFGREVAANCGAYGALTSYTGGGGNAWTGNVWIDGGAVNS